MEKTKKLSYGILLIICLLTASRTLNAQISKDILENINLFKNKKVILDEQKTIIHQSIKNLIKGKLGTVEVYFVGFAGSSLQRVFFNDILLAQKSIEKKFNNPQRSILLANNQASIMQMPLANTVNLAQVIDEISQVMNKDEDILFLFLSSHGGREAYLSTSFFQFENTGIYATQLREMLDKAKIKNKIVVLSACYSGSFIPALQDDNTLIMTAARNDRTSFGCSDEYQYTFFTEAYFKDALGKRRTLLESFDLAKKIIHKREKAMFAQDAVEEEYSLPQIYIGSQIKKTLSAESAN